MKKAYDQNNKLVDIIESQATNTYFCPVCRKELIRNFGAIKQFYSHQKDVDATDCEIKMKLIIKEDKSIFQESESNILSTEFYNKKFDDVKVEMSDYMSEEGYYLTQEQKDIIFSTEDRVKVSALAGCVDGDTEFFHGTGWKKISEYQQGDKVFQFNDKWQGELVRPLDYIKLPCDEMTRYKTKYGIDMVLSDEHNVVYIDTSHNKHNYWKNVNLLKIKESDMRERQLKNKTGFTGRFLTTFDYESDYATGMSESQLRLTIAIMADGTYQKDKDSNWCRMHLKKDYKKDRLRLLLKECEIEYKENQWHHSDLEYTNINFYSPVKLKHFPKEWYDLNVYEREIIFDEISHWDGNDGIGNRGIVFRTSSKEDADFIQYIMSSLNKRSTIDISKDLGKKYTLTTNGKEYIRKSLLYTVSEVNRNSVVSMGQQSKEENKNKVISKYKTLDGYKYCFTVPSGMLILRRNNKIFVTGNSAKTSTIYYYCKERPFSKILYLVYNKSQKDSAMLTFGKLKGVSVMTVHGLAFGIVGRFYKDKLTFNYGVVDIIKDLNLNWNKDMELANKVNELMKQYMLSNVQEFEELEIFKEDDMRSKILACAHRLWELKKSYKNNIKIEHDFYLKIYQLEKKDLSSKYDIICEDECQDQNLMMLDIILNSNVKTIVMIGDKFQAIYGFRNSINIMPLFEATEYKLTTSFRVSQNIAHISSLLISDFVGDNIKMKGFNTKQTIVDKIDKSKPYICLCRTNAFIFSEIADALSEDKNKKLFFEGGYQSYSFINLVDALYFSQGHPTKNKILSKFKDYNTMNDYAKKTEDIELLSLIRMVDKYGSRIIDIVDGIKNNAVTNKDKADIIFSTVHRAKGATYSIPVYISGDHLDIESLYRRKYITSENELTRADKENLEKDISEEIFIIYISATRASNEVELSDSIKRYLLMRYEDNGHELHNVINNISLYNNEGGIR